MPRLPATHHRNSATKKAFQVNVKCDHEKCGQFSDWFPKRPVTLEKIHECGSPWWFALACLFDSRLSATERPDCNTCVIVGPEGQGRRNWACTKVHTSLATRGRAFRIQGVRNVFGSPHEVAD